MRKGVTAFVMVGVLAASGALGASLGMLGFGPDQPTSLRPAIVVGTEPAEGAPVTEPGAAAHPLDPAGPAPQDQVLAPDTSWATVMDQIAADRAEAQRLADERAAADRAAAERAAAERSRASAPKKVVPKPVVRDYDDDDDDEWDDDEVDDDD